MLPARRRPARGGRRAPRALDRGALSAGAERGLATRDARAAAGTLLAAFAGAGAATLAGLPASWLSGAMLGVALRLALGGPARLPAPLSDAGMLLSGAALGAAVTPEMIAGLSRYPLSLALFGASVLATLAATRAALRLAGLDAATAFFAAVPGALSHVVAAAAASGADLLRVTIIQSFRLFVLVAVLPSLVVGAGVSAAAPPPAVAGPGGVALVLTLGLAFALVGRRLGVAAPFIFGGLAASAGLHATALAPGALPAPLANGAFLLVGAYVGSRFAGVSWPALRAALGLSALAFGVGFAVSAAFAALAARVLGLPFGQVMVAFAPGGVEAMIVLAGSLGLDALYVSLHHLARFLVVALAVPFAARHFPHPEAGPGPGAGP